MRGQPSAGFRGPSPTEAGGSRVAASSSAGPSDFQVPYGTPAELAKRVILVPTESPERVLGAKPKVTGPFWTGQSQGCGPGASQGLRRPAAPGRPGAGGLGACQRGGTPLLQPGSSPTAGDAASLRSGPSAQLQLPEGCAARAGPGGADRGGDVTVPSSSPRSSLLAALGRSAVHSLTGTMVPPPDVPSGDTGVETPIPGVPCAPAHVNGGRGRARQRRSGATGGGVRREGEGAHTPPPPRRSFPLPRRKLGSLSPCVRHIGL